MNWNYDRELNGRDRALNQPSGNAGSAAMSKSVNFFQPRLQVGIRQVPGGRELKQTILGVTSFSD